MLHLGEHTDYIVSASSYVMTPTHSSIQVLDHLKHRYECLLQEKTQLESQLQEAERSRRDHERKTATLMDANRQHRSQITQIIELVKDKQRRLETTKEVSIQLESRVKQLKEEAAYSRDQLMDLRHKERQLKTETDQVIKTNHEIRHQTLMKRESVDQYRIRCERELGLLETNWHVLRQQMKEEEERMGLSLAMEQTMIERRHEISRWVEIRDQLNKNTWAFIDRVRTEFEQCSLELD